MNDSVRLQLAVPGALVIAIIPSFGWLLLLSRDGLVLMQILGVAGAPFVILALIFGVACAEQIAGNPWRWSLAALAIVMTISVALLFLLTASPAGVLAILIALPAAVIFPFALKLTLSA